MNTDSPTSRSLFNELTHELARYVRSEITLQTFHSWFVPVLWQKETSGEPAAEELAYDIALRLSEYSNGQWSEPQLKMKLRDLARVPAGAAWRDDNTHPAKIVNRRTGRAIHEGDPCFSYIWQSFRDI